MEADVFGKEAQLAGLRFTGFRFQYDEENDEVEDADVLVMVSYKKTTVGWHVVPEVSGEVFTAIAGHDG